MIKYKVIKQGIETNSWKSDYAGADYYEPCFGKPERWVTETSGEDLTQAIETRQVEVSPAILDEQGVEIEPAKFVTEYKMAAEYTIVEENIDAEITAQKAKEDSLKALKDKFKNLKKSDFDTVSKLGDAFLDLLKLLDLK